MIFRQNMTKIRQQTESAALTYGTPERLTDTGRMDG